MKKNLLKVVHVGLLMLAIAVTYNSVGQLRDRPLCSGAMCLSNNDCGSSCFCSQNTCFGVSEQQ